MRLLFDDSRRRPGDDVVVADAYTRPRPRPANRPWVELCMVASVDGSTVIDQRSGGLSSPTDQEVLLTLRSMADVVVVGASTVRAEGYGPPSSSELRIGVVTRRGDLDLTTPLFSSGRGFLITPEDAPQLPVDTVRAGHGTVDLALALAKLDADIVHAEGGPSINGALAAADLIDEVNLTISPQLAGGDGQRVTAGAPALNHRLRLARVLEADGFLFTSWLRRR
jgi:riboflavin biosynthesis pyrimidine reductase